MPWNLNLTLSGISWWILELISSTLTTSSMSDENKLLEGVSYSWKNRISLGLKINTGKTQMGSGRYLFPSEFHLRVENWGRQLEGYHGR
jgi:hypothetical protein